MIADESAGKQGKQLKHQHPVSGHSVGQLGQQHFHHREADNPGKEDQNFLGPATQRANQDEENHENVEKHRKSNHAFILPPFP